jgi:uncharacterized protein YcfJ
VRWRTDFRHKRRSLDFTDRTIVPDIRRATSDVGWRIRMNKSLITGLAVGGIAVTAAGAFAGYQAVSDRKSAQVLDVEQLTRSVKTPRQVCSDEVVSHEVTSRDPKRVTGSIIGAVAGGVLGNQIGDGSGQTVATVAGAAAGGYAGSKIQKHMQDGKTTQSVEQRCRTVYDSVDKADGYNVRYRLDGEVRTVKLNYDPGMSIPVENGLLVLRGEDDRR